MRILSVAIIAFAAGVESFANDEVANDSLLSENIEWVDTCTSRYAVVHDCMGRCGLYDLENHVCKTPLEYRDLYYSEGLREKMGIDNTVFYGKKSRKEGVICISKSGGLITIMKDDDDLIYSIDSCLTIDKHLSKLCKKLLLKDIKATDSVQYAQVLVVDSHTGEVKAWVAMADEMNNGRFTDAQLRKQQCTALPFRNLVAALSISRGNLQWTDSVDTGCGIDSVGMYLIKDHNWMRGGYGKLTYLDAFKHHSNVAMAKAYYAASPKQYSRFWMEPYNCPRDMDAMGLVQVYNMIVTNDSACQLSTDEISKCKEYLKATLQGGGIGSKWTTRKVDLSGDYVTQRRCPPTLFDEDAAEIELYDEGFTRTYDQEIFTGYLPSDDPRYTICVTMDKKGAPANGRLISRTVNKLAEYLNKKR